MHGPVRGERGRAGGVLNTAHLRACDFVVDVARNSLVRHVLAFL